MSQLIYNDLKSIIYECIGTSNPSDVIQGSVVSADPLQIEVDKNTELYPPSCFLVPENLTDYKTSIVIDGIAKEITVNNALKPGDGVYMIKCHGGQNLLVLDRIGG